MIEKMDLGMNNLRDIPAGLKNRPEVLLQGTFFNLTKKYQHQIEKVLKDFVQVDPRSIPEDVRAMFADFNNLN